MVMVRLLHVVLTKGLLLLISCLNSVTVIAQIRINRTSLMLQWFYGRRKVYFALEKLLALDVANFLLCLIDVDVDVSGAIDAIRHHTYVLRHSHYFTFYRNYALVRIVFRCVFVLYMWIHDLFCFLLGLTAYAPVALISLLFILIKVRYVPTGGTLGYRIRATFTIGVFNGLKWQALDAG